MTVSLGSQCICILDYLSTYLPSALCTWRYLKNLSRIRVSKYNLYIERCTDLKCTMNDDKCGHLSHQDIEHFHQPKEFLKFPFKSINGPSNMEQSFFPLVALRIFSLFISLYLFIVSDLLMMGLGVIFAMFNLLLVCEFLGSVFISQIKFWKFLAIVPSHIFVPHPVSWLFLRLQLHIC